MFKDKELHAKVDFLCQQANKIECKINDLLNSISQLTIDFEKLQSSTNAQEINRLSRVVDRLNDAVVEYFEGTEDVITITEDDI